MRPYPSPCDKCEKNESCADYRKCQDYLKFIRTMWKQFNGYPSRVYLQQKKQKPVTAKFIYEHPDRIRQYLEKGPCGQCRRAEDCDVPCGNYWNWWDARMEWMRRRFGEEK